MEKKPRVNAQLTRDIMEALRAEAFKCKVQLGTMIRRILAKRYKLPEGQ